MEILVVIIVIWVIRYCYRNAHLNRTEDTGISSNMLQPQYNFDINNDCLDEIKENENIIRVFHDNTPIKVIGLGGGGANSIGKMIENPCKDVGYYVISNDYCELQSDSLHNNVSLMVLTPQPHHHPYNTIPRESKDALFYEYYDNDDNKIDVYSMLDISTKYVIIVAGFGGIVGTAGTKWLAEICKSINIPVTVVCTIPFDFEGERKQRRALDAVKILEENGIAIKILYAEDLSEKHEDLNFYNCFSYLDKYVAEAVTEICNRLKENTE